MSNTHDSNCIFCKIVAGEIPCAKVYEDEHVFAFLDLSQVTKGHTLVIPKVHKENLFELTPEIAGELFKVVPKLATGVKDAFHAKGLNILNNNGEIAGQTVFHYHIHLIPRYDETDGFGAIWNTNEIDSETLSNIANSIQNIIK